MTSAVCGMVQGSGNGEAREDFAGGGPFLFPGLNPGGANANHSRDETANCKVSYDLHNRFTFQSSDPVRFNDIHTCA